MWPRSSAVHSHALPSTASLTDTPDTPLAPYLTTGQRAALRSGSDEEIAYADEEALQMAIAASLSLESDSLHAEREAQRKLNAQLRHWFDTNGFDVKPNSGNSNNCLIISMLQHVTGDYHSDHVDRASHYKKQLAQQSDHEIKTSQAMHSDTALTSWLIDQINHDYFGQQKDRYFCFWMVTADLDGKPAVRSIGEGQRAAAIFDGAGHYEAVVARDIRSVRQLSHPDKLP
jgi:hypothetical protein